MTKYLKGCTGKEPFATEEAARYAIHNWKKPNKGHLEVYHCKHVDHWHITSMTKKQYKEWAKENKPPKTTGLVKIEMGNLAKLVAEADLIFLKPQAENTLVQLLDLQVQIEAAIDEANKRLEAAALKVNPNFKSIRGDKIKVFYRSYGSKYKIDETVLNLIPPELYEAKVKTTYAVNDEAVAKFTEVNKGMPVGIIEAVRPKYLKFTLKNADKEEKV